MVMPELVSTLVVLLAIAGALIIVLWSRSRLDDRAGRRLERIEGRLAVLDSALRRIEIRLQEQGPPAASMSADLRVDPGVRPSPSRPKPTGSARSGAGHLPEDWPTLISVPNLSTRGRAVGTQAEAARRATASGELAGRFGRVWQMADEGEPADRIALATGQPIGQVELVLNLRRLLLEEHGEVPG
jgi:hypothetical protein